MEASKNPDEFDAYFKGFDRKAAIGTVRNDRVQLKSSDNEGDSK